MSTLLRAGYKQTEVWVIPDEWELAKLGDVATIKDGTHQTPKYVATGVPFFSVEHVTSGDFKNTKFISEQEHRFLTRSFKIEKGDILMTRIGSIGDCKLIDWDVDASFYVSLALLKIKPGYSSAFIAHYSKSAAFQGEIEQHSLQSAIPRKINLGPISNVRIVLPTPPEQRAIAVALSDVDALLGGLDGLIAKKRDLKQAAMQQLLTGQTRLPGFSGEWEVRRLGELFNFSGGYSASRDQLSIEGHCYLHYGDIHGSSKTTIDTKADHQDIPKLDIPLKRISPGSLLADGDVVFVDASEDDAGTSKHVVVVNKGGLPFISGLHTIVAKAKTAEFAHEYLQYCFQTPAIREQFMFYAVGTKVSGISKSNIVKLTLPVPSVPEQTAIAAVLFDMDTELAKLVARRDKTRDLKQAMMQELLTGRTRLVEPVANIIPVDFSAKPKPATGHPPAAGAHNWTINEAVVVAVLVKQFGSEQYPLGRKRCTKLSYLLHRHVEHVAQGYLKKAAGPYNPAVKYKGPEGIAQKNGYIRSHTQGKFAGFVAAEKVAQAEGYFEKWYGPDVLAWLEQFRFKSNDELELLATVDMAVEDLRRAGKPAGMDAVKSVIRAHPEWEAKLEREIFSDANLARGIAQTMELFQ